MSTWFRRDPAMFTAQLVSLFTALIMLLPLAEGVTAALVAIVIAAGGVVVAFVVARDGQVAALVGLGRAGIAFAVVVGVPISEIYQGLLIVALEQLINFIVRFAVTAPLDANLQRVAPVSAVRSAA
jgi:hypothetical protein